MNFFKTETLDFLYRNLYNLRQNPAGTSNSLCGIANRLRLLAQGRSLPHYVQREFDGGDMRCTA